MAKKAKMVTDFIFDAVQMKLFVVVEKLGENSTQKLQKRQRCGRISTNFQFEVVYTILIAD